MGFFELGKAGAGVVVDGFSVTTGRFGCVFGERTMLGGSVEGPGMSENKGTKLVL